MALPGFSSSASYWTTVLGFINALAGNLFAGTTKPRLRVDVAQTGFFEGREVRTFKEFASATTSTYIIKIVCNVNTILFEFGMEIEAGDCRIETITPGAGIVEGGSFAEVLPLIITNIMTERPSPAYTPVNVVTAGGTLTGTPTPGTTLRDVLRGKAASNSNFSASVGTDAGAERGVPPGTYYWRVTMNGFIGVIKARYEERP